MIYPPHLRDQVIRPVLQKLNLWSPAAENLLLGTAAQESQFGRYLVQLGGPALGIFQMEPATHNDLVYHYLAHRTPLLNEILAVLDVRGYEARKMVGDLCYATVFARLQYRRRPEALPAADDLPGLAAYYKRFYNTPLGAATVEQFIGNYRSFVSPYEEET